MGRNGSERSNDIWDRDWDGNNMDSGNTDECNDLVEILKGFDALSYSKVRRSGDN